MRWASARLDHAAEPLLIERFEYVGEQARGALAQARASARRGCARKRPTAPATSRLRIRRATTPGIRKLSRRKRGEGVADAVLVARDDRGVRDRQAERVAEQRGDREPVGEAADHGRLGECLDPAERGVGGFEQSGYPEQGGHHHQQAGGGRLHSGRAWLGWVETAEGGRAHATAIAAELSEITPLVRAHFRGGRPRRRSDGTGGRCAIR